MKITTELFRNFEQISKKDVSLAGGKGASLGEMTQAGIPVPPGFVILANAFEKFLEETDLNVEIDAILDSVNHKKIHTVENASEKIKALILQAEIPKDIADGIQKFFKNLNIKYVAVRSSATAEDSTSAAWAGQLESYLNTTEANLLENVKRCWASLFTPRAIFYRFEKELHQQKISVAVVIQKMVESEKSGISFSVHPVTQDRNQLIIEAGFGLGEAIVSGQITPDSYVVEKQPRRIIDKNIQIQSRGLYRAKESGNEWKEISKEQGGKQVLTDEEILELSASTLRIENHYGFPCDIEWAYEAGTFYIVQSRPITTLNIESPTNDIRNVDWELWIRRQDQPPFLTSMWTNLEGPLMAERIGGGFTKQLCLRYGDDNLYLRSSSDLRNLTAGIQKFLSTQSLDCLEALFAKSKTVPDELSRLITETKALSEQELLSDIESIISRSIEIVFYTTSMPYFVLEAVEKNKLGEILHAKFIRKEAEKLRATSFYNELRKEVLDRIVHAFAKKYGIDTSSVFSMTIEEIRSTLKENTVSVSLEELAKRENCAYWDMGDGKIVLSTDPKLMESLRNKVIQVPDDAIQTKTVRGATAFAGKVRGIARIVMTESEMIKVQKGDILVAPTTNPMLMSAILVCGAIVTDEGGIASHAAIISRELKKPCIVGTKYATHIIHDGDFVEVDADNGIVRLLTNKYVSNDYYLLFQAGDVHFLFTDMCAHYYSEFNSVVLSTNGQYRYYVHNSDLIVAENSYKEFYKNDVSLQKICDSFEEAKIKLLNLKSYFTEADKITSADFESFLVTAAIILNAYSKFDHIYTDYLFKNQRKDVETLIKTAMEKKNVFREHIDQIFFNDGTFVTLVQKIANQSGLSEARLFAASMDEIRNLLSLGKLPKQNMNNSDYALVRDNDAYSYYFCDEASQFISRFITEEDHTGIRELQGVSVSKKGTYMGTVRKVSVDYTNLKKSITEFNAIPDGIILVADSTVPEMLSLMSRSRAIVTDMGGILSHAAITSRELGIPCIIDTKIGTEILKDGDLVEVDADNGIVRIITAPSGTMLSKIFSREKTLFYFSMWNDSDRRGWKNFLDYDVKHNIFLIPPPGRKGSVWYSQKELTDINILLNQKIKNDPGIISQLTEILDTNWKVLLPYLSDEKKIESIHELKKYYDHLVNWWSAMNTAFSIPDMEDVDKKIRKNFLSYRIESEKYTQKMGEVSEIFLKKYFSEFPELTFCIAPNEIEKFSKNPKSISEIEDRKNGCMMLDGKIFPLQHLNTQLRKNNLSIEEVSTDGAREIKGTPAYQGRVQGQVKKILSFADMDNFKSGDILVTEMTNPNYLPIIKIASAVITDEGGATCHAAITSRELKIPCVVGTKIATQVLQDGDIVDVDAVQGIIKKLE